jgi:hypothetical protein
MQRHQLRAVLMVLLLAVVVAMLLAELARAGGQGRSPAPDARPWARAVQLVDERLQQGDVAGAVRAWYEASVAALASRDWEGMLETGDAYLRIGDASGIGPAARPKARQQYLSALYRARAAGSVEGVLRAAQAFQALGDHDVVQGCIRIAEDVVAQRGDVEEQGRVRAFAERATAAPRRGPTPTR